MLSQITNQKKLCIKKCILKMESNDRLKEINLKNHTCYYFDDVIKFEHLNLDNILTD